MTTAQEDPWAGAESQHQPRGLLTRSRGGHAIGGQIVGRYWAREAQRCQCCRCRIHRGDLVFEVLVDDDVLEACGDCAGCRP
jgi:hypothetical protein